MPLEAFNFSCTVALPDCSSAVVQQTDVQRGTRQDMTRVEGTSVFVQWHNCAVEDEMEFVELVSTGAFQQRVPHHARVLDGSEDGELVTFYYDGEKQL